MSLVETTGCAWCDRGRKAEAGCCGREDRHHHTTVTTRDGVKKIPSGDCNAISEPDPERDMTPVEIVRPHNRRAKQCGRCGAVGHTRVTCGRVSKYKRAAVPGAAAVKRPPRPMAQPRTKIGDAINERIERERASLESAFEITDQAAAVIVERMRPLAIRAMTSPNMLESLIVSCYLAGMVDASLKLDRKGGA